MAFGNNRKGKQGRAHFQLAGGSIIKFKHPYFVGQIGADNNTIDEIDISASCKLEGRYFEANQAQDSAKQIVLIDGSVATVTNKLLNGVITIPAVVTTGTVAEGDLIAACQLIKSVGDTVGGIIIKTDYIGKKRKTRMYYGVTVQRCPEDISEGNDVGVYPITLLYAGWIEAISFSTQENLKTIWAVGTETGVTAQYDYYGLTKGGTGEAKASTAGAGITDAVADDNTANNIAPAEVAAGSSYVDTTTAVSSNQTVTVSEAGINS